MFNLVNPWLLLLLPLPWLAHKLLPTNKAQQTSALKIPFFKAIEKIIAHEKNHSAKLSLGKSFILYFIWALLIFAAAGPQWLGELIQLPRSGRNIMLAVDISGSMRMPDMSIGGQRVNRLAVVKAAASQFIKKRQHDRIGLILFGSKAYLQTPLTFDRKTVQNMLDDATIGLAGRNTAIGDAIGLAIKRLTKTSPKNRILIFLTDGENNSGVVSPIEAAKMANKAHIRIFTIGLGANRIMDLSLGDGLDEKTLKQIATLTDGTFFRATNSYELKHIYNTIDKLVPTVTDKDNFRPIKPLYPWPLALALLISFCLAMGHIKRN